VADGYQKFLRPQGPRYAIGVEPVDRPDNWARLASAHITQDRATMDIQMVKGIPGPDDLEVLSSTTSRLPAYGVGVPVHVYRSQIPNRE